MFITSSISTINRIYPLMNDQLRCTCVKNLSQLTKKQAELMRKKLPQKHPINGVNHIILVASGKGGVGKSTTAVNLATAIKCVAPNKDVGLLDADVFGPSIPLMMNLHETPLINNNNLMVPLINYGVKCMSMGNLITNQSAAIWRGLMVMGAIDKLIRGVSWDHTDYLIVDTPPGTGDTHLSLAQNIPISGVLIVTTGQKAALDVTRRGITMYKKLNIPILGIIQNMSTMKCSKCSNENFIFGDSVQELATQEKIDTLFSIPLDPIITNGCDSGQPIVITHPESSQVKTYKSLAEYLINSLNKVTSK
ncbi:iron-sulfur protein NUBPL isoform X1 [Rhopalosiphum maidis]|uniref:iron-sulfur protein NUBPL isoform X1 n=2 Tax=Rhopalosiphum maidis TaxID=43146 RepID=UPI000EFE628B|nr:iron-sulfur protein NUBPL isoform X1 [Rhopalosiphum maidis]XP_026814724.1 iron-sulfur protein NUBPL isoform X1 [Rhopalosiphum maidis]XP_026814731.1 iron-sulfur protein NUBPL isoform X1 [Rhopalosiphum maidis]